MERLNQYVTKFLLQLKVIPEHAITHKGNRLPIDKIKFRDLQIILVELLKKLIALNQKIKSKDKLIIYIESLT